MFSLIITHMRWNTKCHGVDTVYWKCSIVVIVVIGQYVETFEETKQTKIHH